MHEYINSDAKILAQLHCLLMLHVQKHNEHCVEKYMFIVFVHWGSRDWECKLNMQ